MQAVILAGGFGTRISEESAVRPKPMVEIGGQPILWHIMKIYASHGINDFVICCGYKSHVIKQYFHEYAISHADVTFNLGTNEMKIHRNESEPWNVTLVETGQDSMTGGRIKRASKYIKGDTFLCTYGDGVSDVDITAAIAFHKQHGREATVTAVQPPGRFGAFSLPADQTRIESFMENRRAMAPGSTAATSCWTARSWTASKVTTRCSSRSRCARCRPMASWKPGVTPVSGSRWTRCATSTCWKSCGRRARPPGSAGKVAMCPP